MIASDRLLLAFFLLLLLLVCSYGLLPLSLLLFGFASLLLLLGCGSVTRPAHPAIEVGDRVVGAFHTLRIIREKVIFPHANLLFHRLHLIIILLRNVVDDLDLVNLNRSELLQYDFSGGGNLGSSCCC